jgi:hypothetical protein
MYGSTFSSVTGQLDAQAALLPEEIAPGTYWMGGWVGPRANPDEMAERKFFTLPGLEHRPPPPPGPASRCTDYVIPAPLDCRSDGYEENCIPEYKTV